jgi:alpha-amylase
MLVMVLVAGACGSASPPSSPVDSPRGSTDTASVPPACKPGPAGAELPWWADRVFYEVFVRSFQDSNGDGIGDLRGLIARLDELNDGDPATTDDLGVAAL